MQLSRNDHVIISLKNRTPPAEISSMPQILNLSQHIYELAAKKLKQPQLVLYRKPPPQPGSAIPQLPDKKSCTVMVKRPEVSSHFSEGGNH